MRVCSYACMLSLKVYKNKKRKKKRKTSQLASLLASFFSSFFAQITDNRYKCVGFDLKIKINRERKRTKSHIS